MVDALTRYNPRVLDVSPYDPRKVEKELHRRHAEGRTHYTLSLEGLNGTDHGLLREWASSAGGRLSGAANGGPCSALLSINGEALSRLPSNLRRTGGDLESILDAVGETVSRYQSLYYIVL